MPLQPVQFVEESLVAAGLLIGGGDLLDDGHQRLGDEPPAVDTEMALRIGIVDGGFGDGRAGTRQLRAGEVGHLSARGFRAGRMRACGDQIGNGAAGITTGDQPLADEHRVGACAGVGEQIGGAAYTRLRDPDDIARQPRRDAREAIPIDVERLEVACIDADDLRARPAARGRPPPRCAPRPAPSCPSDSVRSSIDTSAGCSSAATISSSMSAPCARASWI